MQFPSTNIAFRLCEFPHCQPCMSGTLSKDLRYLSQDRTYRRLFFLAARSFNHDDHLSGCGYCATGLTTLLIAGLNDIENIRNDPHSGT